MTDRIPDLEFDMAELAEEPTDSLTLYLGRARLALRRGDLDEAAVRLERLLEASGAHTFLPASLLLGEVHRERQDREAAERMFRFVEDRIERGSLSETGLNLGLAWVSIGHPGCARKVYSNLVRDFAFERSEGMGDEREVRVAAIAAYRLGWLTIGESLEEAWIWWQRSLDAGDADVSPHAALALATEIGSVRLYSARIEELLRQVVAADHPHASPRAALELGKLFARRLQVAQAREFFALAVESEHPEYAEQAGEELRSLHLSGRMSQGKRGGFLDSFFPRFLRRGGEARRVSARDKRRRALIVGAGTGGQYLLESIRRSRPYAICGFVDDRATKLPTNLDVPVLGKLADLPEILASERPDEVFMAIPTASGAVRAGVVRACGEARIPLLNLPTMHELHHDRDLFAQLRRVRIEEVSGETEARIDRDALEGLRGQSVLLIGGAGAIGSALARRMASGQVQYLMLLDRNEAALERLTRELTAERRFSRVFPLLGDAYDPTALEQAFKLRQPSHVFFAAGSAQPRLFEDNVVSAARDEVLGAAQVARTVASFEASRLIHLSSTYAAQTKTPFGAAKALAELGVHAACRGSQTSCTTLRVGSLFRSPGSPVEFFDRQIELGGPVTVPDAQLTRKFLTGYRVAELCLWAARIGHAGERLAVDAGETLNLREMASEMIRLAGGTVDIDTWVDHAPSLCEWAGADEILGVDERAVCTDHRDLVSLDGRDLDLPTLDEALSLLDDAVGRREPLGVRRTLLELAEAMCVHENAAGIAARPRIAPQSNRAEELEC